MNESELISRWGRNPDLDVLPPEVRYFVVAHPRQNWCTQALLHLMGMLDAADSPESLLRVQSELFRLVHHVESARADATRQFKRSLEGKSIADPPYGSWWLERVVLAHVARQLRSVGDGLAWRALGYDRRQIMALSHNARGGPIVGKIGLHSELDAVEAVWSRERSLPILNDLTNILRIGDLTIVSPEGTRIREIKASTKRKATPNQRRRMDAALTTIHYGGTLPNETEVAFTPVDFVSRLFALEPGFDSAIHNGAHCARLETGWALTCLAGARTVKTVEEYERAAKWRGEVELEARKSAGIDPEEHTVYTTNENTQMDAYLAPYSIYPLPPMLRAGLLRTTLIYQSRLASRAIEAEFQSRGCDFAWEPHDRPITPLDTLFRVHQGRLVISVKARLIEQALRELIPIAVVAAAIVESAKSQSHSRAVLTFRNEAAVWQRWTS